MFSACDAALLYLQQCLRQGEGGKTLLVAFQAEQAQMAWAAGLRGEADHANFATFAKFVLQKLLHANGYWLMLPMQQEDCRGYRLELKSPHASWYGNVWLEGTLWRRQEAVAAPLIEDLLVSLSSLPAVMRRDLEQLAYRLEIDTP